MRAPVAIIKFAFFVRGFLLKSYINSEIFTGIWREIDYCNRCAHPPQLLRSLPLTKTPLWKPPNMCYMSFPDFPGVEGSCCKACSYSSGRLGRSRPRSLTSREWPRHCRKEYWTKMVRNGPFRPFWTILALFRTGI